MDNLNSVISKYAQTKRVLGTEDSGHTEEQVAQLKNDLKKIGEKNRVFFMICVGMVLLLFVLSLVLIIVYINDPAKIKLIFGITGVSIMGLIVYMNKLWKEKVATDILLTLTGTLEKEMINTILVALLNKI